MTTTIFLICIILTIAILFFAQHGKNDGRLEQEELEILETKEKNGNLTKEEKQKLKKHEKNIGNRKSRQNKDKK